MGATFAHSTAILRVLTDSFPSPLPATPEGLARAKIDPETGLLARLDDEDGIMELFEAGRLPPMPETGQGDNQDAPLEEDPYEIF